MLGASAATLRTELRATAAATTAAATGPLEVLRGATAATALWLELLRATPPRWALVMRRAATATATGRRCCRPELR